MSDESTTPDPVEGVRRAFEALRRSDVDGFMSTWTPDAVWDLNAWGIGSFEGLLVLKEVLDQDDLTFAGGLDGRDALLSLDTAVLPANDEAPTNEKSIPEVDDLLNAGVRSP